MAAPKPATRIINRGRGHSYQLDGEKVPGVTTIIGGGVPKPALVGWAARTVAEYVMDRLTAVDDHVLADELLADLRKLNTASRYPKKLGDGFSRLGFAEVLKGVQYAERDEAANRGTEVHGLAERLARGEEIDVPDELAGHVESYLQFLEEWQPSHALLERVVVNRQRRYMGKLDMIADFPEYGRGLVDIKTSKGVYGDTALQLAGYRYAEVMLTEDGNGEEPMVEVDWCGVVHVRADGYDVYPFDVTPATFAVFLYAGQVATFIEKDGPADQAKGDALAAPSANEVAA